MEWMMPFFDFETNLNQMKTITCLFFLFLNLVASAQEVEQPQEPYVLLKDGTIVSVHKPIVLCENMVYYTNRYSKSMYEKPLEEIEGFSSGSDVRWMTRQEFQRIGTRPVRGYFWSIVTIYPTGFGIFILSDIIKRRQIRAYYQYSLNRK